MRWRTFLSFFGWHAKQRCQPERERERRLLQAAGDTANKVFVLSLCHYLASGSANPDRVIFSHFILCALLFLVNGTKKQLRNQIPLLMRHTFRSWAWKLKTIFPQRGGSIVSSRFVVRTTKRRSFCFWVDYLIHDDEDETALWRNHSYKTWTTSKSSLSKNEKNTNLFFILFKNPLLCQKRTIKYCKVVNAWTTCCFCPHPIKLTCLQAFLITMGVPVISSKLVVSSETSLSIFLTKSTPFIAWEFYKLIQILLL